MFLTRLVAKNWRNFKSFDVSLRERQFLVGPNAAGKSNFLDILRFLRDIATSEGGGLQKAVKDRGGLSKIRCLAARRDPEVLLEVHLSDSVDSPVRWQYELGIKQETRGRRQTQVSHERVVLDGQEILKRPNDSDRGDNVRLTQTFLEQINSNKPFREVAEYLQKVTYLHLVPQLLRFSDAIGGRTVENDPFGQGFLDRIADCPEKTRKSRLSRIENALRIAVPQLKGLQFVRDETTGRPHLQALYSHWRPNAGWQREDQFSDGTLRLVGLLWSLLETDGLLLLEEPELSLNAGIVAHLAAVIHRLQRARGRQVLVSTHSDALLTERGIDGREVLVLEPNSEGTAVTVAAEMRGVRALLEQGFTVGEVVLPKTHPRDAVQLGLLE